jgi:carbamoyltransferase
MISILGISAFYHDSAAVLVVDGNIIAAAQEERFTRIKHDAQYPKNAIEYVLREFEITLSSIDYVVFYDKPFLKFERLLETYVSFAPRGFKQFCVAMPVWVREKLFLKRFLIRQLTKNEPVFDSKKIMFCEHHYSHAASAFYPSPFHDAIVLTLDGVGEWATTTVAIGTGSSLEILKEINFPHSLGLFYSAVTHYLGFKVNSGEYKVMGLAPYGVPRFKDLMLEKLIHVLDDGTFRLDQSYFGYATDLSMIKPKFIKLFGQPVRSKEANELTQFHMDIAASAQAVLEDVLIKLTRSLAKEYKIKNICLDGGVALNCVANGLLLRDGAFEKIWVQPAAGDAGGALGAALFMWHQELDQERVPLETDSMKGSLLGPKFEQDEIESALLKCGAVYEILSEDNLIDETAKALSNSKAVGWFQNRMEFGPRALGCRSILADPRAGDMQKVLNLKVKYRESFRPFAPSVLCEDVNVWFDLEVDSPYMLFVGHVKESKRLAIDEASMALNGLEKLGQIRSTIPAVTHVDFSARIQTVDNETNPRYHKLISRFKYLTGCPILVNTSFNVRGEPIVCSPEDAFRCFMGTELDVLAIGNYFLKKENQPADLSITYQNVYELD